MSKWHHGQKKPCCNFCKLQQEGFEKANSSRTDLTREETTKLARLDANSAKLKYGDIVQNRQLQTWLSADEYSQIEAEW